MIFIFKDVAPVEVGDIGERTADSPRIEEVDMANIFPVVLAIQPPKPLSKRVLPWVLAIANPMDNGRQVLAAATRTVKFLSNFLAELHAVSPSIDLHFIASLEMKDNEVILLSWGRGRVIDALTLRLGFHRLFIHL